MSIRHAAPFPMAGPAAIRAAASGETIRWRDVFAAVLDQLMAWHERSRQRRQLQSMSDHMLHDIGLGRGEVEVEISKPFC